MSIQTRRVYRASSLGGARVISNKGEKLGEIEDVVLDLERKTLAYAAISFGGFLGIGEKLFAVPWALLELKHDSEGKYFVFDVERQDLRDAPGFDPKNWPDVANPDWRSAIDEFYRGEA